MSTTEDYVRQAAALIGLPLDPAHLPGVVVNVALAARMAAIVDGMTLTPADEPAPVFVAGRDLP